MSVKSTLHETEKSERNGRNELTELQEKLLEMLKWFHNTCEANGFVYYALGGTLIGAVRHQGFIPWDDDIDVGMPRPEYERFIEFMRQNPDERYVLEAPLEHKDFVQTACKLYDTTTTFVEKNPYKTRRGIFLDVFPIDGVGDTPEECQKTYKKFSHTNHLVLMKVCSFRKGRGFIKNASLVVGRLLPYSWRKKIKKLNDIGRAHEYDKSKYVGNLMGSWGSREIVEREWLGEPVKRKFEDGEVNCPQNSDAYLTNIYGDYMQLPPEDKRQGHHEALYLDLERSYLENSKEENA